MSTYTYLIKVCRTITLFRGSINNQGYNHTKNDIIIAINPYIWKILIKIYKYLNK